jgi:hypothetical protein
MLVCVWWEAAFRRCLRRREGNVPSVVEVSLVQWRYRYHIKLNLPVAACACVLLCSPWLRMCVVQFTVAEVLESRDFEIGAR